MLALVEQLLSSHQILWLSPAGDFMLPPIVSAQLSHETATAVKSFLDKGVFSTSSFFFFFLLFVYPLEPLPVSSVSIYDYKPSPETGVLFEIQYPEKYNVFTRVNISYWEGKDYRTMLYKGRKKLFH